MIKESPIELQIGLAQACVEEAESQLATLSTDATEADRAALLLYLRESRTMLRRLRSQQRGEPRLIGPLTRAEKQQTVVDALISASRLNADMRQRADSVITRLRLRGSDRALVTRALNVIASVETLSSDPLRLLVLRLDDND